MKKKIKIGLDFDGVVAYNPFRIIRAPIAAVKRDLLRIKKLSFYYPEAFWQKFIWKILHESSVFPARGVSLLQELVEKDLVEAHLITARYSFLDNHLDKWLCKYNLKKNFKSINLNRNNEQPHLFKRRMIKEQNLEIFIEDNLDIVKYLSQEKKIKAKIYWIYNILDSHRQHSFKYPYLEKALQDVIKNPSV